MSEVLLQRQFYERQEPFDTGVFCHVDAAICEAGTACEYFDENPNQDVTSYDGIGMNIVLNE